MNGIQEVSGSIPLISTTKEREVLKSQYFPFLSFCGRGRGSCRIQKNPIRFPNPFSVSLQMFSPDANKAALESAALPSRGIASDIQAGFIAFLNILKTVFRGAGIADDLDLIRAVGQCVCNTAVGNGADGGHDGVHILDAVLLAVLLIDDGGRFHSDDLGVRVHDDAVLTEALLDIERRAGLAVDHDIGHHFDDGDMRRAVHGHVVCRLCADEAAADDNDVLTKVFLTEQVLVGDRAVLAQTGDGRHGRVAAVGDEHGVGLVAVDDRTCSLGVIDDLNAELPDHVLLPHDEGIELSLADRQAGHDELAAKAVALFQDRDLVAASQPATPPTTRTLFGVSSGSAMRAMTLLSSMPRPPGTYSLTLMRTWMG